MKDFTGIYRGLIIGMKDLGQWGSDEGHLDVSKLQLTIGARREEAKRLVDGGMSERAAAKVLGVERSTIQRDLGKKKQHGANSSKNGANSSTATEEEDPDLPDQKILRARYQRALLSDALGAIAEMTRKTRKEFFVQLREKYGGFDT